MTNIIDTRPKNGFIENTKPDNKIVFDVKPSNKSAVNNKLTEQLYDSTLGAGMLVGFGPHITYPQDISVRTNTQP